MATVYDEGRTFSMTRDGVRVERTLRVTPFSEVPYVCDLLLGGVRLIGGNLFRLLPCRDPWLPWCVCTEVSAEGIGTWTGDSPSGLYNIIRRASYSEGCRLKVTYETPSGGNSTMDPRDGEAEDPPGQMPAPPNGGGVDPTAQQEIDLATDNYDFRVQHLTMDGALMGYARAIGQQPVATLAIANSFATKTIPQIDITLTRNYVIRPPFDAINNLVGRINAAALTKGRKSWAADTLRFDGLKASRQTTSFGVKHYQLNYSVAFMPYRDVLGEGGVGYVGWNRKFHFTRGGGGRWWYVVLNDNPNKSLYDYDTDYGQTIGGSNVTGFQLLFHPRAT